MLDRVRRGVYVAVVGPGRCTPALTRLAFEVGGRLAGTGSIVICGGLSGVMAAVCHGAAAAGGLTVGLLPHDRRGEQNPYVTVAIPTGLGELRNGLIVRSSDVVVALGGSWGTLSEVALGVRTGKPVVALGSWQVLDDEHRAPSRGPVVVSTVDQLFAALDRLCPG